MCMGVEANCRDGGFFRGHSLLWMPQCGFSDDDTYKQDNAAIH